MEKSKYWCYQNDIDADIVCDVCQNDYKDEETGDDLVICDKCQVAVHMNCYGHDLLSGMPSTDKWYCLRCKTEPEAKCVMDDDQTGAIVETNIGWVHISCVNWLPEVGFTNAEKTEVKGEIWESRMNRKCTLTRQKGVCI